jgi:hypothetical protein
VTDEEVIELARSVKQGRPTARLNEMRIPFSYAQAALAMADWIIELDERAASTGPDDPADR